MKKYILLFICMLIFVGCNNTIKNPPIDNEPTKIVTEDSNESLTIEDIFPFNKNIFYQYEGEGNMYAAWDIFIDYINDTKIQRRIITDSFQVIEVLEKINSKLIIRYSENNFLRHEDVTGYEPNTYAVILQEPIELGAKWGVATGESAEVTNMNAEIETPYGSFKSAVEVTNTSANGVIIDYYVKGLGHVKTVRKQEEVGDSTTQLARLEEDANIKEPLNLYLYNPVSDTIETETREISIGTNDKVVDILNEELKSTASEDQMAILSGNAKINSITYDSKQNSIHIDLSKDFQSQMNYGGAIEGDIIKSLVDTLGDFYKVTKASMSIEGKAYESGHMVIAVDQLMDVNYDE